MPPNLHGNGYSYLTKAKTGKFTEIFGSHANSCSTSANVQVVLKPLTVKLCILLTEPQRNSRSVFIIVTTLTVVIIIIDSEHL